MFGIRFKIKISSSKRGNILKIIKCIQIDKLKDKGKNKITKENPPQSLELKGTDIKIVNMFFIYS